MVERGDDHEEHVQEDGQIVQASTSRRKALPLWPGLTRIAMATRTPRPINVGPAPMNRFAAAGHDDVDDQDRRPVRTARTYRRDGSDV